MAELAYGDVAGVTLPAGRPGGPAPDGTVVQAQLSARVDELTPAQRRAVERSIRVGRVGSAAARRTALDDPPAGSGCPATRDAGPYDAALTALATRQRALIAASIPGYGSPTWEICAYRAAVPNGTVYADVKPWSTRNSGDPDGTGFLGLRFNANNPADQCFVRVFPRFFQLPEGNRPWAMGHEMYHCLHQERLAGAPNANRLWTEESLASWTSHQVSRASYQPREHAPGSHFDTWTSQWPTPLFERAYDAFGFFGLVGEQNGAARVFGGVPAVWGAGANDLAVFDAVGGGEQAVLDNWGSGLFRQAGFPAGWFQGEPFAVPDSLGPALGKPTVVLDAGTEQVRVGDHAATMASVWSPVKPLVKVDLSGNGRVTDGKTDWLHPLGLWVCFGGSCDCPPGQKARQPIPTHTDIGNTLYLGMAAGASESVAFFEPHAMSEYCKPDDDDGTGDGGGGGRGGGGGSNGDPHLTTMDGLRYDFQAAGEFVLARAPGLEVQARQEPWRSSKVVSVNTQLALGVGSARVTFDAGASVTVRVGGRVVDPARGPVALQGGGRLEAAPLGGRCFAYRVRWPDGSEACVWSVGAWGVALQLQIAAARRGTLVGLLGDGDGDRANDLRARDGRRFETDAVLRGGSAAFQTLYRVFGQSWRVRQAESLFDYGPGQTTATFTKPGFPARFHRVGNLTTAQRQQAEERCRALGVTDPEVLEGCILDVAVTNDDAFAAAAAVEEDVAYPDTPWQVVAGLEHTTSAPVSLAALADGSLYLAGATTPAPDHDFLAPGQYVVTTLGPDDVQGAATALEPVAPVQPVLLAAGSAGLSLLGYVDRWSGVQPPGTSSRGVVRWPVLPPGAPVDHVAGAGGRPVSYAETPDGTPWLVTGGGGGGHHTLWRGAGAGATPHELVPGASCYDVNVRVVADGPAPWLGWHEWDCTDDAADYGWHVAAVDGATGAIGPDVHVPVPAGARQPLYDGLGRPAAMAVRPGLPGAWLAYTLRVGGTGAADGTLHAFVYSTASGVATDLGAIPDVGVNLHVAATPAGRLWVGWADRTGRGQALLRFRRLAPGSTAFEPGTWTVTWPARGTASPPSVNVEVAARGERLDVVVYDLAVRGADGIVWHTRVG
jgi:hypothetical protein